jgi:hypothetical protein
MFPMQAEGGLATVAVVGENMKHTPGIAGKLFGTLGRSGISVIACAQGASETNISFVVNSKYLRKTLNVIHDAFFLSEYQVLNLFLCGVGTVGRQLIEQIASQQEKLMREQGLKLNVVGLASSRRAVFSREGLDLANYRELLATAPESSVRRLHDEVIGMNIFNSVFVDCTASPEVAALYHDFLEHNVNIAKLRPRIEITPFLNLTTQNALEVLNRNQGVLVLVIHYKRQSVIAYRHDARNKVTSLQVRHLFLSKLTCSERKPCLILHQHLHCFLLTCIDCLKCILMREIAIEYFCKHFQLLVKDGMEAFIGSEIACCLFIILV